MFYVFSVVLESFSLIIVISNYLIHGKLEIKIRGRDFVVHLEGVKV